MLSGLVKHVKIEELQNRLIVLCANLKPRPCVEGAEGRGEKREELVRRRLGLTAAPFIRSFFLSPPGCAALSLRAC